MRASAPHATVLFDRESPALVVEWEEDEPFVEGRFPGLARLWAGSSPPTAGAHHLPAPCSLAELVDAVRRALDDQPG